MIVKWLKKTIIGLIDKMGYRLVKNVPAKYVPGPRFEYQKQFVNFNIIEGVSVLDAGSGGSPFPHATILAERHLESTTHRSGEVEMKGKPLIVCDIQDMPFRDGAFDYVYCCHVLEHVADPIQASRELMRVGKRGFVETPTFGKDSLFCWADKRHKWHVVSIGQNLCFFEYSKRQLEGIRSSAWHELIFSKLHHPLQQAFFENQDIFNVMFSWNNEFSVFVFYLDGTVKTLNAGK